SAIGSFRWLRLVHASLRARFLPRHGLLDHRPRASRAAPRRPAPPRPAARAARRVLSRAALRRHLLQRGLWIRPRRTPAVRARVPALPFPAGGRWTLAARL